MFLLRMLVIVPLIDTIRFMLITLITLAVFYYGVKINAAIFLVSLVVLVAIVVYLDIAASSGLISCTQGKLTPLEEKDKELFDMINDEWKKLNNGEGVNLKCFIMKGQSSHSNVFVSKGKLVIYDSLFEHIREKEHMLAIIRHEMGHAIFNHIPKIVVMRILYYALFFVGMAFAL